MDWRASLSDAIFSDSTFLDAAIKTAVLLALAGVIDFFLRKRSAASRHLIWTLAVVGAVALPALSALLPTWHVLPVAAAPARTLIPVQNQMPVMASDSQQVAVSEIPEPGFAPQALSAEVVSDAQPVPAPVQGDWPWQTWLAVAWACGSVIMLVPAAVGMLSLMRLGFRAAKIDDEYWLNLCGELTAGLGLRRKIVLLSSRERAMPMTWGIMRPKVLLPAEADGWPVERQRLVLMHELAHVKRRDGLAQLFGQIARAGYWFNPLAWVAVGRMAHLRERACDDIVLNFGIKASDYAAELLTVATGYRALAGGMAMARTNRLETRLRAILDGRIDRRILTRRAVTMVALALAGALIPLSTMGTRAKAQDATPGVAAPMAPGAPAPGAAPTPAVVATPSTPQAAAPAPVAPVAQADTGDYKIGKNDELSVSVYDLNGEGTGEHIRLARVSGTGNVALDFIKPVHVEGLTEEQANDAIIKAYHDAGQIRQARVMVTVTQRHNDEMARLKAELDRDQALLAQYQAAAPGTTNPAAADADAALRAQIAHYTALYDQQMAQQLKAGAERDAAAAQAGKPQTRPATAEGKVFLFSPDGKQQIQADQIVIQEMDQALAAQRDAEKLVAQLNWRGGTARYATARPGAAENWTAKLDNEVAVQLLGVSEHPSTNRPWWTPDGRPMSAPYDDFGARVALGNEPLGREFAVRLSNPKNVPADFSWQIEPATSHLATGNLSLGGKPVTDIRAAATALAADGPTTTLLLGVASGAWRMSGEHVQIDQPEGMKNPWGSGDVLFAPANETKDGLEETVSYSINNCEVRLMAIGTDGRELKSSWSSGSGQGSLGQMTARFRDLHAADISKFVLQTRPYQWVEFDKVALWGRQ